MLGCVEQIEGDIVLIGSLIPDPEFELSVLSGHLPVMVYGWVCGKNFVPQTLGGGMGGDSILEVTS